MRCRYEFPRNYRGYGEKLRHVPCDGVVAAAAVVMKKAALISLFYFRLREHLLLH